MPAIVRVKRRIDEEPLSAFVLNGKKRRRLAEDNAGAQGDKDEISTVLKFAGTIAEQDNAATTQMARLTKEQAKELVQQKTRKPASHTERARHEMRQSLHEQRFRVVNCLRTAAIPTIDEHGNSMAAGNENMANATAKPVTIVDIEKQSKVATGTTDAVAAAAAATIASTATAATANNSQEQQPSDSDMGYVYDLYIPENEQQAEYVDLMDDNYLSVRAFDDLVYDECYNNASDAEYDSEDSNQENHFANEYPDEPSDSDDQYKEFDDERDICDGIRNFILDDDEDEEHDGEAGSSSDEDDYNVYQDPYVVVGDNSDDRFVDDIDIVNRYGTAYALYRKQALKRLNDSDDDISDNNDSDDERYHSASEKDDCYDKK